MNSKKIAIALRRVGFALAVTGAMLYGGGCSMRSIGAMLLSNFLTSGGVSSLTSGSGSGLTSLLGQLLGAAT